MGGEKSSFSSAYFEFCPVVAFFSSRNFFFALESLEPSCGFVDLLSWKGGDTSIGIYAQENYPII